jgi:simple sugar transport system ATP-binding protein
VEASTLVNSRPLDRAEVAISFCQLSKRFGAARALDEVTFEVQKGTVHAILGENGAGKTTLMRILAGVIKPDSGWLQIAGDPVTINDPKDARNLGIGMVHQDLALLPALTVAENLYLDDDQAGNFFKPREYARSLERIARHLGVCLAAGRPVWQLTTAERQLLEIARILMRQSSILVLDEPTAHLSPIEGDQLLHKLKEHAHRGATILLVTHKLREIEEFADRVTVLRRGRHVLTAPVNSISPTELAHAMVGEKLLRNPAAAPHLQSTSGEIVLHAYELSILGRQGQIVTRRVSFAAMRGEILGIAGISGNGQEELAEVLAGLARPAAGEVAFSTRSTPHIAYVPADRCAIGAPGELTVAENLTLRDYRRPEFIVGGFLAKRRLARLAAARRDRFQIEAADLDVPTAQLSGGNMQRVVLARELSQEFDLLIAHNPTAGLDIVGTGFVRKVIRDAASRGAAVILISDDLDEIVELTDRVVVLGRGCSQGVHQTAEIDRLTVSGMMLSAAFPDAAQNGLQ